MGFFTAIKKFLSGTDTKSEQEQEPTQTVESALAPEQQQEPTQAIESALAPEQQQEPTQAVESALTPEQQQEPAQAVESALTQEQVQAQTVEVLPEQVPVQKQKKTDASTELDTEQQSALSLALRQVEPRLSAWLGIILDGVEETSPLLWQRLYYLLQSLDAPTEEAKNFVRDFQEWLARMEYRYVEEFRSELQYRLALALELEDEEDERSRLFIKLSQGLARTREQFTQKLDALFSSHSELNALFWEEMEELFLMADVGFEPSMELIARLKNSARLKGITEPEGLRAILQEEVEAIFRMPRRISTFNAPEVIIMVGVNGVGKTTTIAKLAHRDRMQGKKVLIAAADTFRAAATEQLGVWAERVGADFHRKDAGADPAAVAFEAMDIALAGGYDVVYVDTAGRLQTKINLMEELKKIHHVLSKKHPGAPHRSILVIDATTGQNALSQTKIFNDATGVDELILTKLDGTAKGGVAIAVAMQFQVPITYVGLGEKLEDLRPFNGKDFASALLGIEGQAKK